MARGYNGSLFISTNEWDVLIKDGDTVVVEEHLKKVTGDEERAFRERMRAHIASVTDDACKLSENQTEVVGHLSWYGGETAARYWDLFKCKACGKIHGKLQFMA